MEWLTALLTPGVLLGNAVLWVALNNRMHARQWPRVLVRTLDHERVAHGVTGNVVGVAASTGDRPAPASASRVVGTFMWPAMIASRSVSTRAFTSGETSCRLLSPYTLRAPSSFPHRASRAQEHHADFGIRVCRSKMESSSAARGSWNALE